MAGLIQPTGTLAMKLAHIYLYPIKSLDSIAVSEATILPSGALQGDREWAIVDSQGKYVNGKRTAEIHKLRSQFDLAARTMTIGVESNSQTETFGLEGDRPALESWLSQFFGFAVQLVRNSDVGFPDDLDSPGPTVISTETLETVAAWFPGLDLEQTRSRFRTNLEIAGIEPFWEDRLFGGDDRLIPFQIGEVNVRRSQPLSALRGSDPQSHYGRKNGAIPKAIPTKTSGNLARLGSAIAIQPLLSIGRQHQIGRNRSRKSLASRRSDRAT